MAENALIPYLHKIVNLQGDGNTLLLLCGKTCFLHLMWLHACSVWWKHLKICFHTYFLIINRIIVAYKFLLRERDRELCIFMYPFCLFLSLSSSLWLFLALNGKLNPLYKTCFGSLWLSLVCSGSIWLTLGQSGSNY